MASMQPPTLASNTVPLSQFILALSIAKSKPRALSLREYIAALHACIRHGSRPNRHLDAVAFWRDKYHKSEETQIALRARITFLVSQDHRAHTNDGARFTSLRKRKQTDAGISFTSSDQAAKQAKTTHVRSPVRPPVRAKGSQSRNLNKGADSVNPDDGSDVCLRHLFTLKQILSQRTHATSSLCEVLCHLSLDISQSLSFARSRLAAAKSSGLKARLRNHASTIQVDEPNLARTVTALGKLFPFLIQGLDRLCKAKDAQALVGSVIYRVVSNFRDLINTICDIVAAQLEGDSINAHESTPIDGLTSSESETPSRGPMSKTDQGITAKLCNVAKIWMGCLNTKKSEHKTILDGFLYLLLTKVGQNINKMTFFNDEDGTLVHVNGDCITGGASDIEAIKATAPCLIWVLEGALQIASQTPEDAGAPPSPTDSATTDSSYSNGLSQSARTRLQHTVFKAIFGDDMFDDFPLALRPPGNPVEDDVLRDLGRDIKQGEAKDWFTAEVWRLVGFDSFRDMMGRANTS